MDRHLLAGPAEKPQRAYLSKPEIANELATCRALLVPSVCYEGGVPITILEAMSYYTPVLASNIGAIPDIIKPGETGFLFDPQTAESILESIAQLNLLSAKQHKDLIYEVITKEDGIAKIVMTLTAPDCPVAGEIMDEVQRKVAGIEGVKEALVELTFDPPWTKDMMTEEAKLELGFL
ncbi:hypothetical protein FQR65_LT15785 [Abscondita terminalis]|nr:hypothetical protein FQR65_LT15785 [Abscondita terminalis]